MVGVKKVKSERGSGSFKRCGVPTDTQELTVIFYPVGGLFASTELDVDTVSAVEMDDNDLLAGVGRGTWTVLMADVEAES